MVTKKTTAKAIPTVTVETKKISSEEGCCMVGGKCSPKHMIKLGMMVLTVLNTVLLIAVLVNQDKAEALKVGGEENYGLLKQIFVSDAYKAQQKQQIEQAMQMFANPAAMQQAQQQAPAAQQQVQAQQQAPAAQQQAPAAQ